MSTLGFVNVSIWDPDQVCSWMRGLESSCAQYADLFRNAGVNGQHLLSLDYGALEKMKIWKLGCQEDILQSIDQLRNLNLELESETLSVIALRLDCQCRNLFNLLQSLFATKYQKRDPVSSRSVNIDILSGVADVVDTIKCLVPWLDRIPFDDCTYFAELRNKLLDFAFELLECAKVNDENQIKDICASVSSLCDAIIKNSKDSLVIQTSSLELVTLRRSSEEELGLKFVTSHDRVHVISDIKAGSTADLSKKIDTGDEIVQINYQTIIGWDFKNVFAMFSDNKKDVTLTLKKKPRHLTWNGYQKKKTQKKQLPSAIFETEYGRKPAYKKARPKGKTRKLVSTTNDSVSEQSPDDNVSDSEVFHGGIEFPELNNNSNDEEKKRRATVSGGSPVLTRCVIGSTENILNLRPKSYFPVSTNIPILAKDFNTKNIEKKQLLSVEQNNALTLQPYSPMPTSPVSQSISPSPQSRTGNKELTGEVAGGAVAEAPRLLRLVKLNSTGFVKLDSEKVTDVTMKKRNESITSLDSILSVDSYSSQASSVRSERNLKQQKEYSRSERDLASPTPSGLLRRNLLRKTGLNRRISCKDLGGGDCQGWLWKKKEGTGLVGTGKWRKSWFVLKNRNLYYYSNPEDLKAQGVIFLPGFTISPSNESRSKKYAFKVYNKSGVVFMFAAERQDDLAKWMNKIGLSSLANLDTTHLPTTAGFLKPGREDFHLPDFSESDEEGSVSLKDSRSGSVGSSREDLVGLYRHIRAADLDISGADVKAKRSTILRAATLDRGATQKNAAVCHLLSLKRTLKDKEQMLSVLNELLRKTPITPFDLTYFKMMHPAVMEEVDGAKIGKRKSVKSQSEVTADDDKAGENESKIAVGKSCDNSDVVYPVSYV